MLLDHDSEELAVVTHVVAGPHGYVSPGVSPSTYQLVPTWNYSVAHCYGRPRLLDAEENLRVLTRLVDHFERFVCKVKMSQDKDPRSQRQVLEALRSPGPYNQPALADDMQGALDPRSTGLQ